MNTLNDSSRSADAFTFNPSGEETPGRCAGFSLIELLVVTTTVAVLIAMLLPAIQRKREEYAANRAAQNLTAMLAASDEYFRMRGSYPTMLNDLAQFCAASPGSCSVNQGVLTGISGEYIYRITISSEGFEIMAEPRVPGITGSVTMVIGPNVTDAAGNAIVTSTPTPGSDEARQRAFDDIIASGAGTAVQLLGLDPNAASQIRGYSQIEGTLTQVITTLDTNRDGMVSVSEINSYSPTLGVNGGITVFLNAVNRSLMWDTLSEQDKQAVTVATGDMDRDAALLFSYDGLRNLTSLFNGENVAGLMDMLARLDSAEAAEANGNLNRKAKFLKQYRKLVKQGIGTSLTNNNANTLITISTTL